jgi:hypothetical protein
LWALAGLLFVYVGFLGQKQQLLRQEVEHNQTQERLDQQSFESTFFSMFQSHVELRDSTISHDIVDNEVRGPHAFRYWREKLGRLYYAVIERKPDGTSLEWATLGYAQFYNEHQADLAHYFRSLYHIVKFVDASNITNKKRYTSFVRAHVSAYELPLLFYNGLSKRGQKFKKLMEDYAILEHLPDDALLDESHRSAYQLTAFGDGK